MSTADAIKAIFQLPADDGRFSDDLHDALKSIALTRKSLILAFAPKAAGTFFRSAAIDAIGGQIVRMGHAGGGRDVQPYLPTFIAYYLGELTERPLVAHAHMQALPANCRFIETFDLKPVIMLRAIPDMLASYLDMLETDEAARADGLNCKIPDGLLAMAREMRCQFVVDILAPWYASYFATWLPYARRNPGRVCVLDYPDFLRDPSASLFRALTHAGFGVSLETCRAAIEQNWKDRHLYRFNKGTQGRGKEFLSPSQLDQIERLLRYYGIDPAMHDRLMGRTAPAG